MLRHPEKEEEARAVWSKLAAGDCRAINGHYRVGTEGGKNRQRKDYGECTKGKADFRRAQEDTKQLVVGNMNVTFYSS